MSRFIGPYLDFFTKTTDAPIEFGLAGALSCISGIALNRRWIDRGASGIRPSVYFMLTAGSSVARKSTAVDLAKDMLEAVEPERMGPEDFTAEALVDWMRGSKGADGERKGRSTVYLPMPEYGQYLAVSGGYGGSVAATLCRLYDGGDFTRSRIGRGTVTIMQPRVTVLAACAYGMFERYMQQADWVTGLYARFLFVEPKAPRNHFEAPPATPKAEKDRARAALHELKRQLSASACAVSILPQAEALYKDFAKTINRTEDPVEAAHRERLLNAVWRIALLYQLDIDPELHIGPDAMDRACVFASGCWDSFKHVFNVASGDEFSRARMRIWRAVAAAGEKGVPKSTILRNYNLTGAKLVQIVDSLVKLGCIHAVEHTVAGGKGVNASKAVLVVRRMPDEE